MNMKVSQGGFFLKLLQVLRFPRADLVNHREAMHAFARSNASWSVIGAPSAGLTAPSAEQHQQSFLSL